jgi:hypothetical protein
MRVILLPALLLMSCATAASAQWDIQDSGTKASLRGIHSVGKGVAWASGTGGTVLRTEDGGKVWRQCATPPDAEKLDFRGVQAFDAKTAIVMSSGKGDLSRLYRTTDGCQTWELLFTNPDKEGFWDGIVADKLSGAMIIGDPVNGDFAVFASSNNLLNHWERLKSLRDMPAVKIPEPRSDTEGLYAASNSILSGNGGRSLSFATGGPEGAYIYRSKPHAWIADYNFTTFEVKPIPLAKGASAGAFSFTDSPGCNVNLRGACALVVVGGDYKKPDATEGTAAYAIRSGSLSQPESLKKAEVPPHGFRSAVAYDPSVKTWITVGPNGTDISTDDGRKWRALKPGPHDAPDADKNWNALSLPFVVGPNGRIGVLRDDALGVGASH